MMARKIPNCILKGKPQIESKIKTLKKKWSTTFDMVQGCGNSGLDGTVRGIWSLLKKLSRNHI